MASSDRIGRLAPSPTGFLHLGNAWAFWLAWLDVRSAGGRLILRMEDVDPARSRLEYAEAIRRDLAWLGLDWDEEAPPQSARGSAYEQALAALEAKGLLYPCYCTRKELRSLAGAPHVDDAGAPYPGICRNLGPDERAGLALSGRPTSLRLICPEGRLWSFTDRIQGPQKQTLTDCGGDFALRRSDGVYAYQLAVVVDDLAARINSVVRGSDIMVSTTRQLYLMEILGGRKPTYAHLPLLLDHEGERLAKRHAALTIDSLRQAGVRPETILGSLAFWAGLKDKFSPLKAGEFGQNFKMKNVRAEPFRLPENPTNIFLNIQK